MNQQAELFSRKCAKYWCHQHDLHQVLGVLNTHLPVYSFKKGDKNQQTQSVYVDNQSGDVYRSRLMAEPTSMLVRYRWYGARPASETDVGFVEQKIKVAGGQSVKRRFVLHFSLFQAFLNGGTYIL
jgi:SPX domain protein involved in polyphosphate accumulation